MSCPRTIARFAAPGLLAALVAAPSAGTPVLERIGALPGPADLVKAHDGLAYVVSEKTLTVFDISRPEAARLVGSHTFPEKIWGFTVAGPLVYVAADFFGVGILEATRTAAPTLRGSVKTPGQAKSVAVSGARAVVADHMSGVDFLDVSNPAQPALLASFFLDGYARAVATSGSVAYAVDSPTGLYVFDLTRPGAPEPVGVQQSAAAPRVIEVAVAGSGTSARIACLVGGGLLQVYDVTDPVRPFTLATYRTPGQPQRVALDWPLAYVADGREGLQVVDLTVPAEPRPAGSFTTTGAARDVAVSGSLVLVATEHEVLILRRMR